MALLCQSALVRGVAFLLLIMSSASALDVYVPCCNDFYHTEAGFGPRLPDTVQGLRGAVVFADQGCSRSKLSRYNGKGKIMMVERGGCSFAQKVYNAQEVGAIAVVVYDSVYEGLITMNADDALAGLVNIPAVFITRRTAEYLMKVKAQRIALSTKDSFPISPPFFLLSWLFMVTFFFVFVLSLGVLVNRLCCCFPRRTYHINSGLHEPSESATYVEFVEAEMMDDDDQEDKESTQGRANEEDVDDDDDDDTPTVRFSKNDGLSEPFLVSV